MQIWESTTSSGQEKALQLGSMALTALGPGAQFTPPRSPAQALVTRQGGCSQPAADVAALRLDAEMTNSEAQ